MMSHSVRMCWDDWLNAINSCPVCQDLAEMLLLIDDSCISGLLGYDKAVLLTSAFSDAF